jgi:tetratricopeptide (TPR) repeat protein
MTQLHDEPPDGLDALSMARFVDETCIGSGAHATVFRAWDLHLQREIAFKASFFDPPFEQGDSELIAKLDIDHAGEVAEIFKEELEATRRYSLLREARLLARVDHPNVISVLDVGVFPDGSVAIVLPFLEAGGLDEQEFAGDPWDEVLAVAMQIGRGLRAIHEAGILHRDFKPNNILFDRDGLPRIADLGLACMRDDKVAMADWVGTTEYMAPEVFEQRFRDERDDIYAYCMIVYQMFYGHPPFTTKKARAEGRVLRSAREGGMPSALHEILVRGLAPNADERWPDMRTLLRAMKRVRPPTRRRWPWAIAAAGVAAAFGLGLFAVTQPVQADECEEVMAELDPIWDNEIQAELRGALGTRKAGDALEAWATRWVEVRAKECATARQAEHSTDPSPCSASTRDRFLATLHAFRTPHLRKGLHYGLVIAELPDPEHCAEHPEDAEWGYGGLLELRDMEVEVGALVKLDDLKVALARQQEYRKLSMEQHFEYGIARSNYWRAEIRRREGDLAGAARDFELAYEDAQELGEEVFGAEALMGLTAVAGARGEVAAADAYALAAKGVLDVHEPGRVPELLQVHGLALLAGPTAARERGVTLLRGAVEMREDQLSHNAWTRELVSQAYEHYARGLVTVGRASEALEYLDRALRVHQEEFGHGTWRVRGILRQKFLALMSLHRLQEADLTAPVLLKVSANAEEWRQYCDDAFWLADNYQGAGYPRSAAAPLRAGRAQALEHGLVDVAARFDQMLAELDAK